MTLGTLLLTLMSGSVLPTLITTLQAWLARRREGSTITLEIDGDKLEVPANPSKQQRQLIDFWVSRHKQEPS